MTHDAASYEVQSGEVDVRIGHVGCAFLVLAGLADVVRFPAAVRLAAEANNKRVLDATAMVKQIISKNSAVFVQTSAN